MTMSCIKVNSSDGSAIVMNPQAGTAIDSRVARVQLTITASHICECQEAGARGWLSVRSTP